MVIQLKAAIGWNASISLCSFVEAFQANDLEILWKKE